MSEGSTLPIDTAILHAMREPGNPADPIGPAWLEEAMRDITALGSFPVLGVMVTAIVVYLWLAQRRGTAAYLAASVLAGTAISTGLKMVFNRPRPDLTGTIQVFTASFPSGHATVSAVVYLTLGALLAAASDQLRLKLFYIGAGVVLTVLVGLSRLYLGVHYPTDVAAGWAVGTAWSLLAGLGLSYWRSRAGSPPPQSGA